MPFTVRKLADQEQPYGEVAKFGARVASEVAGFPGNLASGVRGIVRGAQGLMGTPEEEKVEFPALFKPPTSEQIYNKIGAGEPEGRWSQGAHEVTKDVVPLLLSGTGPVKSLAMSGLGNLASWVTKQLGGGEGAAGGVKLGTMLATSLLGGGKLGNKALKSYAGDKYKAAEELSGNATVSAKPIEPVLAHVENILSKGHMTPSKAEVSRVVQSVRSKIKDGMIPIDEVWELKRNVNELIDNPELAAGIKRFYPAFTKGFKDIFKEYGKKNPEFLKNVTQGDEIYSAINNLSPVTETLEKYLSDANLGRAGAQVFTGNAQIIPTAAKVGVGKAAYAASNTFDILKNSPTARGYYAKTISSAINKDKAATINFARKFDKTVEKEENKIPEGSFKVKKLA